jgi:hypothetical protein
MVLTVPKEAILNAEAKLKQTKEKRRNRRAVASELA